MLKCILLLCLLASSSGRSEQTTTNNCKARTTPSGYDYHPRMDIKGVHNMDIMKLNEASISDIAKACSKNKKCKSFNHLGYLKKSSSKKLITENKHAEFAGCGKGLYTKKSQPKKKPTTKKTDEGCKNKKFRVNGYDLLRGKDLKGFDIKRLEQGSIQDFAEACNKDKKCKSFNSWGFLKTSGDRKSKYTDVDGNNCNGLYIKKKRSSRVKKCHSTGDPHFLSFRGTKYDNHDLGWQVLFKKGKLLVETEHALLKTRGTRKIMANKAWRVSYDGKVVEEGQAGKLPKKNGAIHVKSPEAWINISSRDFGKDYLKKELYQRWYYNVFVATAEYSGSTGLCTRNNGTYKAPSFKKNKSVTEKVAKKACAALKGTAQFDDCVMDAQLLDDKDLLEEIVEGNKEANKVEKKLDEVIEKSENSNKKPVSKKTDPPKTKRSTSKKKPDTKKKRSNDKKKADFNKKKTKIPRAVYDKKNDCWCYD